MCDVWFNLRVCLYQIVLLELCPFLLLCFYYQDLSLSKFGLFTLVLFSLAPECKETLSGRIQLEISMVSIERASQMHKLQSEPGYQHISFERKEFEKGGNKRIRKLLKYEQNKKNTERVITNGHVVFRNLSARY